MKIISRLYEGPNDFQTMLNLLAKIRPAARMNDFPVKVDIEENMANEEIRANTRLWFEGDRPIGWAYVDDGNNLRWEVEKQFEDSVGVEMVAWGEACMRSRRKLNTGETSTLDASCREENHERLEFIRKHGFHQTDVISVGMKRLLSEPIPEPELPHGFSIRAVKGTEEAEAVASTHRSAFGTEYMTTENRLIIMNSSEYDPSLDLVVIAPDGSIAAYCTCSVNANGEGYTDPVATHPRYQRLGLAKALLLKGMQLLKERGMKSASLGTNGDNIAMQRTAEAVGFRLEHKTLWFEKEVNQID
ncbi:MAG TPA: GNAT family N-acetyltransferase [Anaerolineales bacterium]|nr:GNAT family N-acetyltransferase [Anaerolineales bacterium]HNH06776.1 GNAT family N-acetyltransferase [Anaerolineales bacterium]